jgi:putative intracellular protease/amidase
MQIAILLYDGFTALDAIGPYEVLSRIPGAHVHFVAKATGPHRTSRISTMRFLPEPAFRATCGATKPNSRSFRSLG